MTRKFNLQRLEIRFGFLVLLAMAGLFGISWSATAPNFPAANGGNRFAACPDSPNCVSTQATSGEHQMEPIPWEGAAFEAVDLIKQTVASEFVRAELVTEKPSYLRFEFTSLIFRFVDDVEFLIDDDSKLLHFRSASRVGHSDLGANRRRMNRIVAAFARETDSAAVSSD